ncbi:MAG: hypothetical protein GY816_19350 [Cytophagales bacterium]|nr:hypothetical protein [Cytophagales bacterium]
MLKITLIPVDIQSTKGFSRHWSVDGKSAWFKPFTYNVLVLDEKKKTFSKIVGLPEEYGPVIAVGWENDIRFFVHCSPGEDYGTMIYIDVDKGIITEIKHWGAS